MLKNRLDRSLIISIITEYLTPMFLLKGKKCLIHVPCRKAKWGQGKHYSCKITISCNLKINLILDILRLWISSSVSKIPRYIHSTMFVSTVLTLGWKKEGSHRKQGRGLARKNPQPSKNLTSKTTCMQLRKCWPGGESKTSGLQWRAVQEGCVC